jgi:hypothetical protein
MISAEKNFNSKSPKTQENKKKTKKNPQQMTLYYPVYANCH